MPEVYAIEDKVTGFFCSEGNFQDTVLETYYKPHNYLNDLSLKARGAANLNYRIDINANRLKSFLEEFSRWEVN